MTSMPGVKDLPSGLEATIIHDLENRWPRDEIAAVYREARDHLRELIARALAKYPIPDEFDYGAYVHRVARDIVHVYLLISSGRSAVDPTDHTVTGCQWGVLQSLRGYLLRICQNANVSEDAVATADDLIADALVSVIETIAKPSAQTILQPRAYIARTAVNLFNALVKAAQRRADYLPEVHDEALSVNFHREADARLSAKSRLRDFGEAKYSNELRDKRTRADARARVDGFLLLKELEIEHPGFPLSDYVAAATARADEMNHAAGRTVIIIPDRSTLYRWNLEANSYLSTQ